MNTAKSIRALAVELSSIAQRAGLEGNNLGEVTKITNRLEKLAAKLDKPRPARELNEVSAEKKISTVVCQPAGPSKPLRMSRGESFA